MLETPLSTNRVTPADEGKQQEGAAKESQTLASPKLYSFNAYHLAEAMKLKEVAKIFELKPATLVPNRLVYELGENCLVICYNFGSVVFFNMEEAVQKSTLERIRNFLPTDKGPVACDTFLLEEMRKAKNSVFFDKVVVHKTTREKVELIALILAQSVALDFFENKVENILNQLEQITSQLEKSGKPLLSEKKVRQFIGTAMAMKQKLIATLYLLEKPDETWEDKTLDDLHQEATMMFELKERFRALDYKLKTIQENLELLANFTANRQLLILEGAIVGLFILDILLFGYELFLK